MVSSWIWTASSRVGAMMSTIGPSPGASRGCALMWIIAGREKAIVFPDPVAETALHESVQSDTGLCTYTRSRPERAIGQDWD